MKKLISFTEAINNTFQQIMEKDSSVICFGLGVDDPKAIFNTTKGLKEKFGSERVFDTPTSEAALTGIAIGLSLNNFKPVLVHQRLDFFLLTMDQLVNSAAKWYYMFGGQKSVPIVIRVIMGRGWGQGPTHSQNLQSWFAHIPGLKVVMPSNPSNAKGLLASAIADPNPVIFMEHRWLHESLMKVPDKLFYTPIGEAEIIKKGSDISIIAMSFITTEAIKAIDLLEKNNVSCDLIDLLSIKPIDWSTILSSVKKTGRVLVLDSGFDVCSVASEIISYISINSFKDLKCSPRKLTMPDIPEPTGFSLTKNYHFGSNEIIKNVFEMLNIENDSRIIERDPHDIPGDWFKGPF